MSLVQEAVEHISLSNKLYFVLVEFCKARRLLPSIAYAGLALAGRMKRMTGGRLPDPIVTVDADSDPESYCELKLTWAVDDLLLTAEIREPNSGMECDWHAQHLRFGPREGVCWKVSRTELPAFVQRYIHLIAAQYQIK